jgi:hypothetical protein
MLHYSVRIEHADLKDSWFMPQSVDIEYYNMVQNPSFNYYFNPRSWSGILIDMKEDSLTYHRQVWTFGDWLS